MNKGWLIGAQGEWAIGVKEVCAICFRRKLGDRCQRTLQLAVNMEKTIVIPVVARSKTWNEDCIFLSVLSFSWSVLWSKVSWKSGFCFSEKQCSKRLLLKKIEQVFSASYLYRVSVWKTRALKSWHHAKSMNSKIAARQNNFAENVGNGRCGNEQYWTENKFLRRFRAGGNDKQNLIKGETGSPLWCAKEENRVWHFVN